MNRCFLSCLLKGKKNQTDHKSSINKDIKQVYVSDNSDLDYLFNDEAKENALNDTDKTTDVVKEFPTDSTTNQNVLEFEENHDVLQTPFTTSENVNQIEISYVLKDTLNNANKITQQNNVIELITSSNEINISSQSKMIVSPFTYILSNRVVFLNKSDVAYEVVLRPDVREMTIISTLESILIKNVDNMVRKPINSVESAQSVQSSVQFDVSCQVPSNTGAFSLLTTYTTIDIQISIGVNLNKQRVVLLHLFTTGNTTILKIFADKLFNAMVQGLHMVGVSMAYLLQLYQKSHQLVPLDTLQQPPIPAAIATIPYSSLTYDQLFTSFSSQPLIDSVLDLPYVSQLQASYAYDMSVYLTIAAKSLDDFVSSTEQRCARLMTLLQPMFQRAALQVPPPPAKRPLQSYELDLADEDSIQNPSVKMAKKLILRARKLIKDKTNLRTTVAPEMDDVSPGDHSAAAKSVYDRIELINAVARSLQQQLEELVNSESQQRLDRKRRAVSARVAAVEAYRRGLISALHARNPMYTTAADQSATRTLRDRCRVIAEPLLLESAAALDGRRGSLFVTLQHLYFHCTGEAAPSSLLYSVLSTGSKYAAASNSIHSHGNGDGSLMRLLPLSTITTVAVAETDGCVVVTDSGGQDTRLQAWGPTSDHSQRVADLLEVILQLRTAAAPPVPPVDPAVPEAVPSTDPTPSLAATQSLTPSPAPSPPPAVPLSPSVECNPPLPLPSVESIPANTEATSPIAATAATTATVTAVTAAATTTSTAHTAVTAIATSIIATGTIDDKADGKKIPKLGRNIQEFLSKTQRK